MFLLQHCGTGLIPGCLVFRNTVSANLYRGLIFFCCGVSCLWNTAGEYGNVSSIKVNSGPWLQVLGPLAAGIFSLDFTVWLLLTELQRSLVVLQRNKASMLLYFCINFPTWSYLQLAQTNVLGASEVIVSQSMWQSAYNLGCYRDSLFKGVYSRALLGDVSSYMICS